MKIRRLLVTTFIALIIPIRVLGEELVVYNSTVEAENNNYTQSENTTIDENAEEVKDTIENSCENNNCDTEEIIEASTPTETQENEIQENTVTNNENISANINYSTHVQNIGWQHQFTNGEVAGTTGKSLRLEAIKIKLDSTLEGNVEYAAHVQNIGWQNYVANNEISGTTGRSLRLEAIRIRLTGEIAEYYDVYYRVHIQEYGWLGWTKNGESAGSQNLSLRLEAIEIKLLPKDDNSITIQNNSFFNKNATITYQAHVQNIGNQSPVNEGSVSGTTGKSLRLEALKINLITDLAGAIEYQSFIEKDGWEESIITNGNFSGTIGKSKAMQLIKMNLTDELANQYDIYYRVHSEVYGWLGWAKNGEIAGVNHYSIEAIQIKLYFKADSSKYNLRTNGHYIEKVSYKPVHYLQKDSRWNKTLYGKYQFGRTGCSPTSMAMAFTGILNRTILPTDVGSYLYYHTNEFNKKTQGSSGKAIIYAANKYNIKLTPLMDKEDIIGALEDGKIVYAAMGNGKYGKPTYNHAIIFYGHNNGKTTVYDPLHAYDISENIDLLWNEQSTDPDDYRGGSNFYSLERY